MNQIEVNFGDVSLMAHSCQITNKINSAAVATLSFDKGDFFGISIINYLDEVTVNSLSDKKHLFTGNIVSIKVELDDQIIVVLSSGVELTDTGIKFYLAIGVDHKEVAYSLARLADIPKERINIPGLDRSIKKLTAFVPFKGLLIGENEMIGEVHILNRKTMQENLPKTVSSEVWDKFLDADGWIAFRFTSAHFADAEDVAIEKADVFLSAYSGLLQYSYSQFDRNFIEWERSREVINLNRQSHILLVMPHNGGKWLRDLSPYKPVQTPLKPIINLDIGMLMAARESLPLPLLVWNRFRDSEDYYIVTIGLWQVLELLSSDVKLPKRFTKKQLNDLSSRAGNNLADQERILVKEAIGKLNQRALMEKLKEHLKVIGIVLNKQDSELLDSFRKIRNAIEHGQKPEEPSVHEIKRVKALTNRIILASLKNVQSNITSAEEHS